MWFVKTWWPLFIAMSKCITIMPASTLGVFLIYGEITRTLSCRLFCKLVSYIIFFVETWLDWLGTLLQRCLLLLTCLSLPKNQSSSFLLIIYEPLNLLIKTKYRKSIHQAIQLNLREKTVYMLSSSDIFSERRMGNSSCFQGATSR